MVATCSYGSCGEVLTVAGADAALAARNPLRYRGYCYDTHSGLYHLPARSYDPATARLLTPDPAPPSAGDPLSLNRYAYCVGDPVNASDPTGAVTDVEAESWKHYYYDESATAGNRAEAEQATRAVVLPVAQARGASVVLAAQLAAARAAAAAVTYETVGVGDSQVAEDVFVVIVADPGVQGMAFFLGGAMTVGAGVWLALGGTVAAIPSAGVTLVGAGYAAALIPIGLSMMAAGWCMIDASGDRDPELTRQLLGKG